MDRDDSRKPDGWKSLYGSEPDQETKASEANAEPDDGESAAAAEPATGRGETPERGIPPANGERIYTYTNTIRPVSATMPEPQQAETPVFRQRRKPRVMLWSFLIALCLVLCVIGGALLFVWNGLQPPAAKSAIVRVTIDKGMRAKKVSELLEKNGLIRNANLFSGWMKLTGEGSRFQAGVYELTPGMTREQIVAKLNAGEIVAAATMRFTIPEGFTVQQIADRLAKAGYVNKEAFLQAASDPSKWTGSAWTGQIPLESQLRFPLEGYLFPETYEMRTGSPETDIINRMLTELDKKLNQLPEEWQITLQERGMTIHQLLTIASLVEREVAIDEERPIVAGIIENRLKKKMPLQIDATIQYLLDKQKEKLLEADLKVDSPYNTYLNPGLPPGPIATPSLKSVEAALYPAETDFYYYVTKKDGSKAHLFAVTLKQHQKNIQLSNKNEKK